MIVLAGLSYLFFPGSAWAYYILKQHYWFLGLYKKKNKILRR